MRPSFRNRVILDEHRQLDMNDPAVLTEPITNVIFDPAGDEAKAWIGEATAKIGDWRSFSRSAYIRWALLINAAHVAEEHYRNLAPDRRLVVGAMRSTRGQLEQVPLKTWVGPIAAAAYTDTIGTIAGYAVADLYGVLEEVVFDAYEILLRHEPRTLLEGDEFRALRRIYARRQASSADEQAWQEAWSARFDKWRRKRAYDPLHRVLKAFFKDAQLKRPSYFEHTDIDDWCATVEMVAELRHLVTHGEGQVSDRLAELCRAKGRLTWDFQAGAELRVDLHHLQSVEFFHEQLLTALNVSLCEKGWGRSVKKDLAQFQTV